MYSNVAASLEKGIRADLLRAVLADRPLAGVLATVVPSTARSEKYAWLGEAPAMIDITETPLEIGPTTETSYEVENRTFATAIGISKDDIEDEQISGFRFRFTNLIQRGLNHISAIIVNLLINGDEDLCYDGGPFFADAVMGVLDHPARGLGGVDWSNIIAETGTDLDSVMTDLDAAMVRMLSFVDEAGEPFHGESGLQEVTVAYPPALDGAMREAIYGTSQFEGSHVRFTGVRWNLVCLPRLAVDGASWYYLNSGGPGVLPLLYQARQPLEVSALDRDNLLTFMARKYMYKVEHRGRGGYFHPQNAIKVYPV